MAEYTIETYRAGHWFWVVRDKEGTLLEYGTFCWTRRKARKTARKWIEDRELRDGRSKADIRQDRLTARTMRKETYGG